MLWKKMEEWANTLYSCVRELGMQESVMTVDELSSGDEVSGTGKRRKLAILSVHVEAVEHSAQDSLLTGSSSLPRGEQTRMRGGSLQLQAGAGCDEYCAGW